MLLVFRIDGYLNMISSISSLAMNDAEFKQ